MVLRCFKGATALQGVLWSFRGLIGISGSFDGIKRVFKDFLGGL